MSNNPIIRFLKVIALIIIIIPCVVAVMITWDALSDNADILGNYNSTADHNYSSIAENYTGNYILAFFGIIILVLILFLFIGGSRRPPEQEYYNQYLGGNLYER